MNATPSIFFERLYLPASNPLTLEEIIILIRPRRWEYEITAYRAALAHVLVHDWLRSHSAFEGNRNHRLPPRLRGQPDGPSTERKQPVFAYPCCRLPTFQKKKVFRSYCLIISAVSLA